MCIRCHGHDFFIFMNVDTWFLLSVQMHLEMRKSNEIKMGQDTKLTTDHLFLCFWDIPILPYPILSYPILSYSILTYTTLHYTTLHYTTLHYTTLHYTTLHYTTLHYTTLHYTTLHYTIQIIKNNYKFTSVNTCFVMRTCMVLPSRTSP